MRSIHSHKNTPQLALAALATALLCLLAVGSASAADLTQGPSEPTNQVEVKTPSQSPLGLPDLSLDPEVVGQDIAQRRRTRRRTRYRRRYYRSRVHYGPRAVVVVPGARRSPPPIRRVVTDPPITKRREQGYSLTLRAVGVSYGETQLSRGTLEGDDLAGFGMALRTSLDRHWGLEMAIDLAGDRDEDRRVAITPVSFSLLARLFPDSKLDIYGLGGVSVVHTVIEHRDLPTENFLRGGAHLGLGAEIKIGRHLLVTADVRYLFLQARPDPTPRGSAADPNAPSTSEQGLTALPQEPTTPNTVQDDYNDGVQAMFGVGYRW